MSECREAYLCFGYNGGIGVGRAKSDTSCGHPLVLKRTKMKMEASDI